MGVDTTVNDALARLNEAHQYIQGIQKLIKDAKVGIYKNKDNQNAVKRIISGLVRGYKKETGEKRFNSKFKNLPVSREIRKMKSARDKLQSSIDNLCAEKSKLTIRLDEAKLLYTDLKNAFNDMCADPCVEVYVARNLVKCADDQICYGLSVRINEQYQVYVRIGSSDNDPKRGHYTLDLRGAVTFARRWGERDLRNYGQSKNKKQVNYHVYG